MRYRMIEGGTVMANKTLLKSVHEYLAELHARERRGETPRVVVRSLKGSRNQLSISVEPREKKSSAQAQKRLQTAS